MNDKEIELDEKKLMNLKGIIYDMERENLKTKKYRKSKMEERALKAIERVVLD